MEKIDDFKRLTDYVNEFFARENVAIMLLINNIMRRIIELEHDIAALKKGSEKK